jgi:hypothetical protein
LRNVRRLQDFERFSLSIGRTGLSDAAFYLLFGTEVGGTVPGWILHPEATIYVRPGETIFGTFESATELSGQLEPIPTGAHH